MRAHNMLTGIGTLSAAAALALVLSGCGASVDPRRAAVCGEIRLDGKPLAHGSITFFPTGGTTGPAAGGTFENGRYSIARADGPVAGKNRVEIRATRNTGRKVQGAMGDMIDEYVEQVPAQYNTQSTLEIDVEPGKNVFNFNLD